MYKFILLFFLFIVACTPAKQSENVSLALAEKEVEVELLYGLDISDFLILKSKVERNQFLSEILNELNIGRSQLVELEQELKWHFNTRNFKYGKTYCAFLNPSDSSLAHFVYEINAEEFLRIDLCADSVSCCVDEKPVSFCTDFVATSIESSLYESLLDQKTGVTLAWHLAKVYDWSIDFFRLQKGDSFRVVFQNKLVDGKEISVDKILAAEFFHNNEVFTCYSFEDSSQTQYYDQDGKSLKRRYLKAPLDYTRISSGFSRRRYHPVQRRYKPHLGIDYAAPRGTPIRAIGDGTISEAKYKRYNGNYVKIRHSASESSQYLHLNKIAKGIKAGKHVKQGELIGYVGSTGLATGPHLCYRFWKDGVQINPISVQAPPSDPLDGDRLEEFFSQRDSLKSLLYFTETIKAPSEIAQH